jgi:arylsulfatase A-like enzyme
VPKVWSDKYKGKFDDGWDALREKTLAKQKKLGVVPKDAELTNRHDEIPGWDHMPSDLKPVLSRQMELYAGFLEQTDHEVGRLIDAINDLGVLSLRSRFRSPVARTARRASTARSASSDPITRISWSGGEVR